MTQTKLIKCGVVMPISAIDGCTEHHWSEVFSIIKDAILQHGFEASLVSEADDVGVIHKRIVQNLYENPIVICDVSCRNANVMFELGMRLAFDKPTIIIKDELTPYSFDTSSIEHIPYPRDLRFGKIVEFKAKLAAKVASTAQKATSDPGFSPFLKQFGDFQAVKIDTKEVSGQEFIIEELKSMRRSIDRLDAINTSSISGAMPPWKRNMGPSFTLRLGIPESVEAQNIIDEIKDIIPDIPLEAIHVDGNHLLVSYNPAKSPPAAISKLHKIMASRYPIRDDIFS